VFLLISCIILTSFLTLWFKVIERYGISNFQVIVINYVTAVITGSIVNGRFPINNETVKLEWFPWAMVMGFIFILLFNIIGFTAQRIGVSVASVANKLSMVIPFMFSLYLYNENATILKVLGIVLALMAVILTCWPSEKANQKNGNKLRSILLFIVPAILFFASGLLDTMIKYVEHSFLTDENKNDYLISAFSSAAAIGGVSLIILLITKKQKFEPRAVLAGICLGVPNYFSIWCLVQVLKQYGDNSSAIIPINNMGIVLFSAVVAWLVFKEHLSTLNWIGIILALGAIGLIAYG
jgi:drug/metabolite transporter (DMT)-like permease